MLDFSSESSKKTLFGCRKSFLEYPYLKNIFKPYAQRDAQYSILQWSQPTLKDDVEVLIGVCRHYADIMLTLC